MCSRLISRLYTFIEWVKETLESIDKLRDSEFTFNDSVFDQEMNQKIKETGQNYDRLLFKGIILTELLDIDSKINIFQFHGS